MFRARVTVRGAARVSAALWVSVRVRVSAALWVTACVVISVVVRVGVRSGLQ